MALRTWALLILTAGSLGATQTKAPTADLAGGHVRATLYLPDAASGYYQGTRFDWAGAIAALDWNGHSYFGKWFDRYDPKLHDAITGPVEEFLTNGAGLGYADARVGDAFVKIGVGAVRKPDEAAFHQFNTYDIVDPGVRTVTRGPGWIEFGHDLGDTNGYAYAYRKRVRVLGDTLVLEHHLKNTGRKPIATSVYEHDFYMIDNQPTGPDIVLRLPFALGTRGDLNGLALVRGQELTYTHELQGQETLHVDLTGFGATSKDYDIRVENRKTGVGVRQRGDRALARLDLWSPRSTICPEAYIDLAVAPGAETVWTITYDFYRLAPAVR